MASSLNISILTPDSQNADDAIASYTEGYTFVVKNDEAFPIAFKSFTQKPDVYTFTPSFGIVMPESKVSVTIRLRVPNFYCRHLEGNADVSSLVLATKRREDKITSRASYRASIMRPTSYQQQQDGEIVQKNKISDDIDDDDAEDEELTASEGISSTDGEEGELLLLKGKDDNDESDDSNHQGGVNEGNIKNILSKETRQARRIQRNRIERRIQKEKEITSSSAPHASSSASASSSSPSKQRRGRRQVKLEKISSYLRTQIDAGVFKVEIRVLSVTVDNRTPEAAYLSRQHTPEAVARRILEKRRKATTFNSPTTMAVASEPSSPTNKGSPTSEAVQEAVMNIRSSAHMQFDEFWKSGIPHSTHTICCRTMREDIYTFFAKIISSQSQVVEKLKKSEEKLRSEVTVLEGQSAKLGQKTDLLCRRIFLADEIGLSRELVDAVIPPTTVKEESSEENQQKEDSKTDDSVSLACSATMKKDAHEMLLVLGLRNMASSSSSSVSSDAVINDDGKHHQARGKSSITVPLWVTIIVAVSAFCLSFFEKGILSSAHRHGW